MELSAARHRKHKKSSALPYGILCGGLFVAMLSFPSTCIAGARAGLSLCGDVIVPSLFPMLALSTFLIDAGFAHGLGRVLERPVRALFRLPGGAAAALVLGLIGGYPVGAAACAGLHRTGELTKDEAERLLAFSVNSSPAFIIGAVGAGMLGSPGAGCLIYTAHIASSLVIGLCLRGRGNASGRKTVKNTAGVSETLPPAEAFVGSVISAASGIVNICAFVVLFSSLSALLTGSGLFEAPAAALGVSAQALAAPVKALLEVSNGCAAVVAVLPYGLPALSVCLSWSGLSVMCQADSMVRGEGMSIKRYVLSRLPHMFLSATFTLLLMKLFPSAVPAFSAHAAKFVPASHSAPSSAALLIVCALMLLSMLSV